MRGRDFSLNQPIRSAGELDAALSSWSNGTKNEKDIAYALYQAWQSATPQTTRAEKTRLLFESLAYLGHNKSCFVCNSTCGNYSEWMLDMAWLKVDSTVPPSPSWQKKKPALDQWAFSMQLACEIEWNHRQYIDDFMKLPFVISAARLFVYLDAYPNANERGRHHLNIAYRCLRDCPSSATGDFAYLFIGLPLVIQSKSPNPIEIQAWRC